jgi:hypothetical protein
MLASYVLPPTWSDSDMLVGEGDLNVLRSNAFLLDGLTRLPPPIFSSGAKNDTGSLDGYSKGRVRVWWGGLEYRTGMTTLTIEGRLQAVGKPHNLELWIGPIDGPTVQVATRSVTTGTFTWTYTLPSGTDHDLLQIEIYKGNNNSNGGAYFFYGVYATPVTITSTWPGVPTFASVYQASLFNQLGDAQEFLASYLSQLPTIPWVAQLLVQGTSKPESKYLWYGTVATCAECTNLHLLGEIRDIKNAAERLKLFVDNTEVWDSGVVTKDSTTPIDINIGLSIPTGTRKEAYLRTTVTSPRPPGTIINSRYTFDTLRITQNTGYALSMPTAFTYGSITTDSALNTALNQISAAVVGAYNRIAARPDPYQRYYAFRRRFATDQKQNSKLGPTYIYQFPRSGKRLKLHGKNMKLCFGGYTVKMEYPKKTDGSDDDDTTKPPKFSYTFLNEISVGETDKATTVEYNLDTASGLAPGVDYYVTGDVGYCAEFLR